MAATYLNDEHLNLITYSTRSYTLAYDALGRCVKRTVSNGQTSVSSYYIYDGEKSILEYNSSGVITAPQRVWQRDRRNPHAQRYDCKQRPAVLLSAEP
jgi:YD repeat-containing protein